MIERLEQLLAAGKDDAGLRFALASRYFASGDIESALAHAEIAVELDAGYSAAWRLLGQIQTAAGQELEAAESYRRGIAAAESRGDQQAGKEMRVFLKRLQSSS